MGGNDTYTHFVKGNSGFDFIIDSGGKDHLLLLNYRESEVEFGWHDINENGKADSLGVYLDPKGVKNAVIIYNAYDDTKRKAPFRRGRGWIEDIRCCGTPQTTGAQTTPDATNVGIKTPP